LDVPIDKSRAVVDATAVAVVVVVVVVVFQS